MSLASRAGGLALDTASRGLRLGGALVRSGVSLTRSVLDRDGASRAASPGPSSASSPASTSGGTDGVVDLTVTEAPPAPFPAYERLTGDSVMRHVRDSDDLEHLREIEAFERAHKARKGVLQALDTRLAELAR